METSKHHYLTRGYFKKLEKRKKKCRTNLTATHLSVKRNLKGWLKRGAGVTGTCITANVSNALQQLLQSHKKRIFHVTKEIITR